MSSRLPRTRQSRPIHKKAIGIHGSTSHEIWAGQVEARADARRAVIGVQLDALEYRLDPHPDGYAIVKPNVAIVARCYTLDAVEAWIRQKQQELRS